MKPKKNAFALLFLLVALTQSNYAWTQVNSLFSLGDNLVKIAKSDNPDKILDLIDNELDLDKKAEILESFLIVKDKIINENNKDKIKLFNAIKQDNATLFIITDGQNFYIVKSQTSDVPLITEHFALIKNQTAQALKKGQRIYKIRCYSCHGKEAKGGIGPNLTDNYWKFVNSAQDLQELIAKGKKGTMMIAYKDYLNAEELKAVTLYIKALHGKPQKNPKKKEGDKKEFRFTISSN